MSYLEDTIDWQAIGYIDRWLDENVSDDYKNQPLAQDWARTCKVIEELGEAISRLIQYTGQNPRKPVGDRNEAYHEFLIELADTAITAILGMMHFTKSPSTVRQILREKIAKIESRAIDDTHRRLRGLE